MSRSILSGVLRGKIAFVKGLSMATVLDRSPIREELGVSSMELLVIITEVAQEVGVDMMKLSERDVVTAHTVADLERVFASKLA